MPSPIQANGRTTASTGICRIGNGLNHPQNKHPPSQLPDIPSNKELTINHLFDLSDSKQLPLRQ